MSEERQRLPERREGSVEVRHRAGQDEAPEAGVPQVGRIEKTRKRARMSRDQRRRMRRFRRETRIFMVTSGIVSLLVIGGVILRFVTRPQAPETDPESVPVRVPEIEVEVSPLVVAATGKELEAAVEAVVRSFMNSESNEERCRWVIGGDSVLERMNEFYARDGESPPLGFDSVRAVSPYSFGGVPMQVVQAICDDGVSHLFNVFPGAEQMLIDWDSSVGYGEMSWERFLKEKPTEPVQLRVFLAPDEYYNFQLSDDAKYQCYVLTTVEREEVLYGYAERGSAVERTLAPLITPQSALPARLSLKFLPWSRDKRMVWIEELIHPYWVDAEGIEGTLGEE